MYIKIADLKDGVQVRSIYYCASKRIDTKKTGGDYANIILRDNTGSIAGKIWNLSDSAIRDFEQGDFIEILGSAKLFNGSLQMHIISVHVVDRKDIDLKQFIPSTDKNIDEMYDELKKYINSIKTLGIKNLLEEIFIKDVEFIGKFKYSSAAKTVHHAFLGGLMEHTLGVTRLCEYYCTQYNTLNRDLLIAGALLHDIGKVEELSNFPENDYTDDGQLLGHIMIGYEMVVKKCINTINLTKQDEANLKHLILSHHGELEYGSPKKPAIIEAFALNLADVTDSKLETVKEYLNSGDDNSKWIGFNNFLGSNIARTKV